MSSLPMADRQSLEAFFGMSSGYVFNLFDKRGIDIDSSCSFE
jgi:hypothetical protein